MTINDRIHILFTFFLAVQATALILGGIVLWLVAYKMAGGGRF